MIASSTIPAAIADVGLVLETGGMCEPGGMASFARVGHGADTGVDFAGRGGVPETETETGAILVGLALHAEVPRENVWAKKEAHGSMEKPVRS